MSLTVEILQAALVDNKSYNATQPFIQAIQRQNQDVMMIINGVFKQILSSQQVTLMSKLLVLRLYKDIFMTGNIDFLDQIDEEIQQVIISAAAYNPNFKSKGKNDKQTRGGMYFVQNEKRPKNNQTLQLSNSFVLLATQIVKFFAAWLPQYPEKTSSRFLQIYEQLADIGVQFQTNIYFQSSQKQKFQQNFEKWKKRKEKKSTLKNKNKNQKENMIKQNQLKNNKQYKDKDESKDRLEQSLLRQSQKNKHIQQLQCKIQKITQQNTKQTNDLNTSLQLMNIQKIRLNQTIKNLQEQLQRNRKQNLQIIQQRKLKLKNQQIQKEELNKQLIGLKQKIKIIQDVKNDALQKGNNLENQVKFLKKQNHQLKNSLKKTKQNRQNSSLQINSQNKQALFKIEQLQRLFQQQKSLKEREKQQKQKQIQKTKIQIQKVAQLMKTLKKFEYKEKQNQIKIYQSQITISKLIKDKQQIQSQLTILKRQKTSELKQKHQAQIINKLAQTIIKQQQLEQQKKIISTSYNDVSEINLYQKMKIKLQSKSNNSMSFGNFIGLKSPSQQLEKYSKTVPNFFTKPIQERKNYNSIHKTQNSQMQRTHTNNFTGKKTQNINHFYNLKQNEKNQKQNMLVLPNKSISTTVFPFIPQYFSPINIKDSMHFRSCCLSEQSRNIPFFKDQLIQLKINNRNMKQDLYFLQFFNKQQKQITVSLVSQSQQLKIRQNSVTKVSSLGQVSLHLQIKIKNLNFRYPILAIYIKSQNNKQQKYILPLPITLFNSLQLSQSLHLFQKFEKSHQTPCKRYKSDRIKVNSLMRNIENIFPNIIFQKLKNGNIQGVLIATINNMPQVIIKLKMIQIQQYCQFESEFYVSSKMSEAFSKIALQILMFSFI